MGGSLSRSCLCPLFRDLPEGLCPPVQALARPRPLLQGDHHSCTGDSWCPVTWVLGMPI